MQGSSSSLASGLPVQGPDAGLRPLRRHLRVLQAHQEAQSLSVRGAISERRQEGHESKMNKEAILLLHVLFV